MHANPDYMLDTRHRTPHFQLSRHVTCPSDNMATLRAADERYIARVTNTVWLAFQYSNPELLLREKLPRVGEYCWKLANSIYLRGISLISKGASMENRPDNSLNNPFEM